MISVYQWSIHLFKSDTFHIIEEEICSTINTFQFLQSRGYDTKIYLKKHYSSYPKDGNYCFYSFKTLRETPSTHTDTHRHSQTYTHIKTHTHTHKTSLKEYKH